MLHDYYIYPVNVTWEDCKRLWGNDVRVTKNKNGTRFYMYKNRHMNVLVGSNGTVMSLGVYSVP